MPGFSLCKWYMDATDEAGNAYIGYWASLRWNALRLHFDAHLWHSPRCGTTHRAGLIRSRAPQWASPDELRWNPPGIEATWRRAHDPPIIETLLDTSAGRVEWHCVLPRARATIRSRRHSLSGWGYVERLETTVPPWKLPLETLRWGRCLSDHHSLVWIGWEGPVPLRLAWHNGRRCRADVIRDDRVETDAVRCELASRATLRSGPVVATVLGPFRHVAARFPPALSRIDERKRIGTAMLHTGHTSEAATAIFESVTW